VGVRIGANPNACAMSLVSVPLNRIEKKLRNASAILLKICL